MNYEAEQTCIDPLQILNEESEQKDVDPFFATSGVMSW